MTGGPRAVSDQRSMRTYDTKHACYGGTAGLMAATEWIASGAGAGRVADVIASDIARYGLNTAGEPTQGGAAVAMLVSEQPKLLSLDVGLNGACSTDVYDFWRPHGRREALVDGHYSIGCYLDAFCGAYRGWRERALAKEVVRWGAELPSEQLARVLYHVPFCKMARKAHGRVRLSDLEDVTGSEGSEPMAPEAREAQAQSAGSYAAQVASSLGLNSRVGNAYTASLYLALAGVLQGEAAQLAGKRIGLFSYGSGCVSEFFSGVVGSDAAAQVTRPSRAPWGAGPVPSSRCSGRMPSITASAGRPSTSGFTRLMRGEPKKPATKRFAGASYSSRGGATCCTSPWFITTTRSESVMASAWSWVT